MKEKIIYLRNQGKTYTEISKKIGCSKSTVSYYCGTDQKKKTRDRVRRYRGSKPFLRKIESYRSKCRDFQNHKNLRKKGLVDFNFGIKEVEELLGDIPRCYLTGDVIDIQDSKSFHFDHIVPVSKGGLSTLDNLGITTKEANQAKSDLSVEDFLILCKKVLIYNGYKISK